MACIEDLGRKIGDLEEKINFIETKKTGLNEVAKAKLKSGDKNGARQALAKKKKYDEQIKQFDGAIMMMEEQKMMLESAESMKSIFDSVKKANEALTEANKGMNVEDFENVREKMEDMKDQGREISDFLTSYSVADDADLDDELDAMEADMVKDNLPKISENAKQPEKVYNVPVAQQQNKARNDEDDLNAFLSG